MSFFEAIWQEFLKIFPFFQKVLFVEYLNAWISTKKFLISSFIVPFNSLFVGSFAFVVPFIMPFIGSLPFVVPSDTFVLTRRVTRNSVSLLTSNTSKENAIFLTGNDLQNISEQEDFTMKKFFIIGSVILILFGIAVYLAKPGIAKTGTDTEKVNPHRIDEVDTNALCHRIDEQKAKYNADCRQLLSAFLADLEKNVAPDFARAEFAVPSVVNDLSGFKVCGKLCYKAAKDMMTGSHDFTDAFIATMDVPIIRSCVHANMVASDMLCTLCSPFC